MTNGKRNKVAGHNWEREGCRMCHSVGYPHVATTRAESRNRDALKIDLMNSEEDINGRFFLNVQCKNTSSSLPYGKLLEEMPDGKEINIIWHKQTRKVNDRFIEIGRYAILNLNDFLGILRFLKENNYESKINQQGMVGDSPASN